MRRWRTSISSTASATACRAAPARPHRGRRAARRARNLSFPRTLHVHGPARLRGRRGGVRRLPRAGGPPARRARTAAFASCAACSTSSASILGGSGLGVARSAFEIARAQRRQRSGLRPETRLQAARSGDTIARNELAHRRRRTASPIAPPSSTTRAPTARALMKPAAMAKLVATETAKFCAERHRADPGRRRPHQGIRPRRADLSRCARAADRRRHVRDGEVPDRLAPICPASSPTSTASAAHGHRQHLRPGLERYPDHTALVFERSRAGPTRDWYARVRRFAQALVRPRACVRATASPSTSATSETSVTTYFACQMLGAVAVPLNFRLAAGRGRLRRCRTPGARVLVYGRYLDAERARDRRQRAAQRARLHLAAPYDPANVPAGHHHFDTLAERRSTATERAADPLVRAPLGPRLHVGHDRPAEGRRCTATSTTWPSR